MRTLSHLMAKHWPETKGSQADKYSRLGLGRIWGFLYAHVTFEAVFRSFIPLAIWHICRLCFSILVFFLEVKFWLFFQEGRSKRASGAAGRPEGEAAPTSFTDHLPHPVQGHDHIVKQPRVRGEKADGGHGLPGPTPPFKTCRRVAFSETDFRGYCFYKHPTHSLSKLREIAKDREAWRAAVHGVIKSGTRLSDRHTLISLAGKRGFVWGPWPSNRV